MTTQPSTEKPAKKKESLVFRLLRSFLYFLLEIFIPVVISLGVVYIFGSLVNFGTLSTDIISYIFAAAVVVFALIISTSLDRFTFLLRGTVLPDQEDTPKTRRKKFIKIIISGFILPLGLVLVALFVRTTLTGDSYMSLLVQTVVRHGETTVVVDIGKTVAESDSYETKIQGIKALSTIHTTETLDQIMYIVENDSASLENQSIYQILSTSIASYDAEGLQKLLDLYKASIKDTSSEENTTSAKIVLEEDLYGRYFADAFAALQEELDDQATDAATRRAQTLQLDAAEAQLKVALNDISPVLLTDNQQDLLLALLMDTALKLKTTQNDDIYQIAVKVANDTTRNEMLRGKAIVLIGRLGSESDFAKLYAWMSDPSEYIRSKTLYAVDQLYRKINNLSSEEME